MTVRIRRQVPRSAGAVLLAAMLLVGAGHPAAGADPATVGTDGYVHVTPNGTVLGVDPYYPKDGNGGYLVDDYRITVDYTPQTRMLRAKAVISAETTQELSRFNVDLRGLTVRKVSVDGKAAAFTRQGEHELVITPGATLAKGARFTVEVGYDGIPEPIRTARGKSGWQSTSEGGAVAAGMPHAAMTWFPVNGTEVDKATVHLTVTVPDGWSVVGNGIATGSGARTFSWAEETPIAPSATMIGIGRWQVDTGTLPSGAPLVNAYEPGATGQRELGNRLPEVVKFLSGKLGDYPQSAAGGLFLRGGPGYSVGAQTRPVHSCSASLAELVYATAYQWWGAGVSIKMWKDAPLMEAFANYAVWLWDQDKDGVDLDRRYRDLVARSGPGVWAPKLTDPGRNAEFAPATKGALMVHALRRTIGDELFAQVYEGFPSINLQSNQNWHDFELYASAVTMKDLEGFYAAWLEGTGKPAEEFLFPGPLKP